MAVFRVERNTGYTVMSNHHLRNKELTLKAKGLLSQMLSLPEDWDYTLAGLSHINREKIDAIREAVRELERAGYIVRSRERDEKGRLRGADYVIYEQPQLPPTPDLPTLENPMLENPTQEKPTLEKPTQENPMQLNKDIQRTDLPNKEKSNTDIQSTHSIPIHSPNPSPFEGAAQPPERKRKEPNDAYRVYEEIIKDNICYDILKQDMHRMIEKERSERMDEPILSGYLSNLGAYTEGRPAGEWVTFPTTAGHMKEVFDRIGIDFKNYGEWHFTEFQSPIPGLAAKLGEHEHPDELNYLGKLLEMQFDDDREKFAAAIALDDQASSVEELINLAQNLDCYWLYPSVHNEEDYGHYLVDELEEPGAAGGSQKIFHV